MQKYLVDWLVCPACRSQLEWDIEECIREEIEQATTSCRNCGSTYRVQEGIGVFLAQHLPRADLWQQVDSGLKRYLNGHAQIKQELLRTPLINLSPADQFFCHMILEEEGFYTEAQEAEIIALQGIYTDEYWQAWQAQLGHVVGVCSQRAGPIVDLASGKCYLVEKLLAERNPVVATDFSPSILRKTKKRLDHFGMSKNLSFLAVDARCTPFRDGAITLLTTNLGLPNIEQAGDLLAELRRICDGDFYAIHHFFPKDDLVHQQVFAEMGNESVHYQDSLLEEFKKNHWKVNLQNICSALAKPTPRGILLEGAEIDRLPKADVLLKWCTIHAN